MTWAICLLSEGRAGKLASTGPAYEHPTADTQQDQYRDQKGARKTSCGARLSGHLQLHC